MDGHKMNPEELNRELRRYPVVLFGLLLLGPVRAEIPVTAINPDGPPTPEQISIFVPVSGPLDVSATASVRMRRTGTTTWALTHPLFRIRPEFSNDSAVSSIDDSFAWTFIGLDPGTSYDFEVQVTLGAETKTLTRSFTTRALPGAAPPATIVISTGSTNEEIQNAINSLSPGDVLEFEDGVYAVDDLTIGVSGTDAEPIYIRGQSSRDGVVLSDTDGEIIRLTNASNVVIENLSLRGSGQDGGTTNFHWAVFGGDSAVVSRVTIRDIVATGVNQGVVFDSEVEGILVYDSTFIGNNRWTSSFIDSNLTWNDDGIRTPGSGNAVFNNTLIGFGDSLSVAAHVSGDTSTDARGIHFYRNDVRNSGDDFIEADHGRRNITFYDNRVHNAMTFLSLDPLYGGPLIAARNVAINIGRTPFKWNSQNSGQFVFNNTIVISERDDGISGWYQPNNGPQRAYGYRNNILIYRGVGNTLWIESGGHDPIDFTHNCWYPDREIQWGSVWPGLAEAQADISPTSPIFSNSNRRLFQDRICERDPFVSDIELGPDYHTEVEASFTPRISRGTAPANSGVEILNITDGYTGAAPDRGAIIDGRPGVIWGDRNSSTIKIPNPPQDLQGATGA